MSQPSEPAENPAPVLPYASIPPLEPVGLRPWWVYTIAAVYLLFILAVLTIPLWPGNDDRVICAIAVAVLLLCGSVLIIVPVRSIRRRPVTRRSIWLPIIGAGLFAAALVYAAAIALAEYWRADDRVFDMIIIGTGAVWVLWSAILIPIAYSRGPMGLGMKLHRMLIVGSLAELLVAVPTHIIVRRRTECCAGICTGIAICIGAGVMLISFGPSVLLLFYRRRNQLIGREARSH